MRFMDRVSLDSSTNNLGYIKRRNLVDLSPVPSWHELTSELAFDRPAPSVGAVKRSR
jgi:hypothetical protein